MNDASPSHALNRESQLPRKIREQFREMIEIYGEYFLTDSIREKIGKRNAETFKMYTETRRSAKLARQRINKHSPTGAFDQKIMEFNYTLVQGEQNILQMMANDAEAQELFDHIISVIMDDVIGIFEGLTINEAQILSPKKRKERAKKIRTGQAEPFKDIPLTPYVPHFIRWLCNEGHEKYKNEFGWPREDWDSDAISIIRGYLISKNQNGGKAQFRLEDFDLIKTRVNNAADDFGVEYRFQTPGIKPVSAAFIPMEGADFVRLALSKTPHIQQSKLPEIWQADAASPVTMPDDITALPDVDILHADSQYIAMHLKNESAAKSYGANPAWCITRESKHWHAYKDNFIFVCDANGERYGINLRLNICDNSADLPVPLSDVLAQYDGLQGHIQRFWTRQIETAKAENDYPALRHLLIAVGINPFYLDDEEQDAVFLEHTHHVSDISSLFVDFFEEDEIGRFWDCLLKFFEKTEQRKNLFIGQNYPSILFDLFHADKLSFNSLRSKTTTLKCALGDRIDVCMQRNWDEFWKTPKGTEIKAREDRMRTDIATESTLRMR